MTAARPAAPALRSLPAAAPLAMPAQDLRRSGGVRSVAGSMAGRRLVLLGAVLAVGALHAALMLRLFSGGGISLLEGVTAGVSTLLCAWLAFGFVSAAAGFVLAWRGGRDHRGVRPVVRTRTAILMPAYNEDPGRVLAAVQAMYEDLQRLEVAALYDVFVLSDTRDAQIASAEATGVLRLRLRLGQGAGIYYRRRAANIDRKAGNIADWVRRHGGAYESMLVLDADSVMTGEAIVRLTAAMEQDPALGLLQTAPQIVGADTPFARLQQFASWLYGPVFALGQDWWSGSEGNYWGHNAIIRVRAFAQSAGLPHLPGRAPFGGHIQSHDFVEAALLRRAGWAVRMSRVMHGSYEETPPTLIDTARRDRRWCQGNLQHVRLLGAAGLHWVSRLHLARGVFSYLASPLWLLLLACGSFVWPALEARPDSSPELAALFAQTLGLLMIPKGLALLLALRDRRSRAGFGGALRLVASALVETAASVLTAPVLMMMQATAVVDVLLGRDSGWGAQSRDDGDITPREAWRAHRAHVFMGVFGASAAALIDTNLLLWTSPVFAGLALSSFLSLHTARAGSGRALRRRGLLQTPAERATPHVLARVAELRAAYVREAADRWEIELLMRGPVAAYQPAALPRAQARPVRLAA